jgi:cystathionine beta-lyase
MANSTNIDSMLIRGGIYGDKVTGAVNTPIYQTSTFKQPALGENTGYEYSRSGNPTREALEILIAELEGGEAGFAFASGMAAITAVISLFSSGDKIAVSGNVYGGTFRVLDKIFSRFGLSYSIGNTGDVDAFAATLTDDVKAIILESPSNPLLEVTDIEAFSKIAKARGILLIVDNTFMTPYLQRPIEYGADIVVHSATKYLGGHSDILAGLAIVNSAELAERLWFIQNSTGGVLQPFDSFLLLRSIKTLAVRMDRHVENAEKVAQALSADAGVKAVYYPGLPDSPGYEVQKKQATGGGGMISFELHEGYDVEKFFRSLEFIDLAESLGGVESLISHPSTMTHASIPEDIRRSIGITEGLIRLSVGIEAADDIISDLKQAIAGARL